MNVKKNIIFDTFPVPHKKLCVVTLMACCKEKIEAHEGSLSVDSNIGN